MPHCAGFPLYSIVLQAYLHVAHDQELLIFYEVQSRVQFKGEELVMTVGPRVASLASNSHVNPADAAAELLSYQRAKGSTLMTADAAVAEMQYVMVSTH